MEDETEIMDGRHHGKKQLNEQGRDETGMRDAVGDGGDRRKEPAVGILTGNTDGCFH